MAADRKMSQIEEELMCFTFTATIIVSVVDKKNQKKTGSIFFFFLKIHLCENIISS